MGKTFLALWITLGMIITLTGCVSTTTLSSGPLGYDTMALPIANPTGAGGAAVGFLTTQISLPGSIFYVKDRSLNGVLGLGGDLSSPGFFGFFLSLPVSVSGFAGAAYIDQGITAYYPDGALEPYWGATAEVEPCVNYLSQDQTWRLGLGMSYTGTWETGPYADFRKTLAAEDSAAINASPSAWSGGEGLWVEFAMKNVYWYGMRLAAETSFPNLSDPDIRDDHQDTGLFRTEVWAEVDQNRYTFGYTAMFPLNSSFVLTYQRLF